VDTQTADADAATGTLMQGRRGLIMGVANHHSIAWGIAQAVAAQGARLAFTYQGDTLAKRVGPLAESVNAEAVLPCDVEDDGAIDTLFDALGETWDGLDFVVHAIAYSDKTELDGRYVDTTRSNFRRTLDVSCFSFAAVAKRAAPMMTDGGALLTLTFSGSERVMPNYNVMGVAKAALEASVRYLAADLGPDGIRVNAISAGPVRTLAGSAIGGARGIFKFTERHSPLRSNASLEHLGGAGLYLLSDLSGSVTGEVLHVDGGFNAIGMPHPKTLDAPAG
jgi:enoyl-[acyl-carrier protein] reductase I